MMVDLDARHFSPAARGELWLPRCPRCHRWWWYPTEFGPCCASGYEWVEVPASGHVFTTTEVHRRFVDDFEIPYRVGLVIPDAAPEIRLVVRFRGRPQVGTPVRLDGVATTGAGSALVFAPA
ncbi:Zn-ribbon domain-containing OB-fold protein [Mycolicibacterium thermoresistibile]|uniref:DUF35 domain-containing protein n=2 Tax=Mycolicibacterium thermoresistibile TaxID=1797 RepID=G7CB26_MYCT3|nr:OB-fold domain-containing protein [Mycolicibacterium thermoresistibile]EHI14808.1 hypothetical protein KEK_00840 [Mycolicibacterium thermoresistibile ATCC 19527]MCV7191196.1 hypothetical protein [Mycolicibacterium thermoresistibile]